MAVLLAMFAVLRLVFSNPLATTYGFDGASGQAPGQPRRGG